MPATFSPGLLSRSSKEKGGAGKRENSRLRRFRRGRGEAHLVRSPFLLLDALLVDAHHSVVGRGRRVVILFGYIVRALAGLILGCGVVGDGREDGRGDYVLERGEHLGTTRLDRGTFKAVGVRSAGGMIIGEVEMDTNFTKRSRIS